MLYEQRMFFLEETVQALVETKALGGRRGAYAWLERSTRSRCLRTWMPSWPAASTARGPRLSDCSRAPPYRQGRGLPLLLAIADAPEPEVRAELAHLQAAEFLYETGCFQHRVHVQAAITHEVGKV